MQILTEYLGDLYEVQACRMNPSQYGWPVERCRQYIIMRHRQKTICFAEPLGHIIPLFLRDGCLRYTDIMVASKEEIESELVWSASRPSSLAKATGVPTNETHGKSVHEQALTKSEAGFLAEYREQAPHCAFMLGQNPLKQSMTSSFTTTQTVISKAHIMWADDAPGTPRWLCPYELLVAQGVPAYRQLSNNVVTNSFLLPRSDRHRAAVIRQAGNAMHVTCIGAMEMYAAAFITRMDTGTVSGLMNLCFKQRLASEVEIVDDEGANTHKRPRT